MTSSIEEPFKASPQRTLDENAKDAAVVKASEQDTASFASESSTLFDEGDFSRTYLAKSKIITDEINNIGWGKYHTGLFIVCGFGWYADNAFPIACSLIMIALNEVDGVHLPSSTEGPFLTLAQNLGLFVGAFFWSLSSDIIGRRWAFVITFLFIGVFAVIAGASPNFGALGTFFALLSTGVGGSLPVDSAIYLEFLPSKYQYTLTLLSTYWAFAQLITNLLSWGLISTYSCSAEATVCYKKDNWGWRYFMFTLGGLTLVMFLTRYLFHLFESPRYFLAKGDEVRAVEVIHKVAKINGKESLLTVEDLRAVDDLKLDGDNVDEPVTGSGNELLQARLKKFNLSHVRQCFGSRKLAISSGLVIFTWGLIGLAFPLYNAFIPTYLLKHGFVGDTLTVQETYRNSLIVSVLGIPGSIIGGFLVETKAGRKGILSASLLITGIFLFASTTAKSTNANLGWTCGFSFITAVMYGVLYAYTPEVFPAKIRGTAVGLAASANRIFGIFAPIIAMYANLETSAPIYVSGTLFLLAGILVIFFPYEPRGKSSY
ncbi:putative uncharacterized MFS-type transporter PB1E7.08c [[Candida] railenensis]|uniref:Uncharacterized MFS-type transporter PB1E7.08c n=1 Tax=[Candida] railenensis TaxID=45579 RepID=A0A9P0VZI0_9ASCO|nr:putative uncharacterized MFS-type transporter PB1E7.08c [[Candida] railenensis]